MIIYCSEFCKIWRAKSKKCHILDDWSINIPLIDLMRHVTMFKTFTRFVRIHSPWNLNNNEVVLYVYTYVTSTLIPLMQWSLESDFGVWRAGNIWWVICGSVYPTKAYFYHKLLSTLDRYSCLNFHNL